MTRFASRLSIALFSLGIGNIQAADELHFNQTPFSLPIDTKSFTSVDLNNDGRTDLLAQLDEELRVYLQTENGFNFTSGFVTFTLDSDSLGWDFSNNLGQNPNKLALVTLEAGAEVKVYQLLDDDTAWTSPISVLSGLRSPIGAGVHPLNFVNDVNGDGLDDLILPEANQVAIHLKSPDGFLSPIRVETETRLNTTLYSPDITRRIGQSLHIPNLLLRDVNNDGAEDLISDTEQKLAVFLADTDSQFYFSSNPSYTIDREEIEARLGKFDIENLDFANLTGVLALSHEEILEDIDGDNIADLLLREGGKVSIFGGHANGLDLDSPRQVLRSGGNVLSTFLNDEDGDGKKDLWLWRVEPISVGDIFVWLALSGSISVEAFVYRNEGNEFARRPSRKITVALKFPSVIRLATSLRNIADEARAAGESVNSLSANAQLNNDFREGVAENQRNDLLVLVNDQLKVFYDAVEIASSTTFLGALNYSRDRDNYTIDLKAVVDAAVIDSDPLNGIDTVASLSIPLTADLNSGGLVATRINKDSLDDIFVFTAMTPDAIEGILLLSE